MTISAEVPAPTAPCHSPPSQPAKRKRVVMKIKPSRGSAKSRLSQVDHPYDAFNAAEGGGEEAAIASTSHPPQNGKRVMLKVKSRKPPISSSAPTNAFCADPGSYSRNSKVECAPRPSVNKTFLKRTLLAAKKSTRKHQ